jgi:hypothetical protein
MNTNKKNEAIRNPDGLGSDVEPQCRKLYSVGFSSAGAAPPASLTRCS